MSREQATEFLKKISTEKVAAEKFQKALRGALVKAGKEAGFEFTRVELDAALAEMKAQIPEEELQAVAGGGGIMRCPPLIPPCPMREQVINDFASC